MKNMRMRVLVTILLGAVLLNTSCANAKQPSATSQQEQKIKETKKMNVKVLTQEEFKNKVMDYEANPTEWKFKGDKPAIIDFYATWCGPCKATAPVLDELAQDYSGQLDIYKVDVDQEQQLAALFGIRSVPSLLFIPMEGKPTMQMGAMDRAGFERIIKSELLK